MSTQRKYEYRYFGQNTTPRLGHRGKFRRFIAVSFRRNTTYFRPHGHFPPPAHPRVALLKAQVVVVAGGGRWLSGSKNRENRENCI